MAKTSRDPKGKKLLRQRRDRRKMSLENKSREFSKMCGADVCLGIRIRESGQVFIFTADPSGFWSFLSSQLVCYGKRSPAPSFPSLLTFLGLLLPNTSSKNWKRSLALWITLSLYRFFTMRPSTRQNRFSEIGNNQFHHCLSVGA